MLTAQGTFRREAFGWVQEQVADILDGDHAPEDVLTRLEEFMENHRFSCCDLCELGGA